MYPQGCPPDVCGGGFMDSACLIYHLMNTIPTKLINLGLPNGSSAQVIFETIDEFLGSLSANGGPIQPISTNAIRFIGAGIGNHILTPTLILASGTTAINNIASILQNGLYVPDLRDWKVKINATDFPDYLNNKLVGGIDPSGIVSITTGVDPSGVNLVAILPDINVVALANNTLFDLTLANNQTFLQEIAGSSTFKNALVSPNGGNIIVDLSNGLYASGGTQFSINNPIAGNIITANGSTSSADGQSGLTYINGTLSAPFIAPILPSSNASFSRSVFDLGINLTNANYGVKAGDIGCILGTTLFSAQVSTTFSRGYYISPIIAEPAYNTTNASTITGLLSSISAKLDIFGNGTYTALANFRTTYPSTDAAEGGVFAGSITDYYAIFIGDSNGDEGGISHSLVTNSYAIFQEGSTLLNSFATAVVVTSDERIKTNIENFNIGLSAIENVNVVKYNFKENTTAPKRVGVLAQQVETVLPEAIHTSRSDFYDLDDFKRLDSDVLVYVLINAVKELAADNRTLNGRLLKLEGK